jgi:hypothetical protein
MAKTGTEAAKPTTIPVRLSILVHVDPDKWTATAEAEAPTVDEAAVLAGLLAAGIAEDQAKTMVAQLTAPAAAATGPSAVRTEMRAYMLAAVAGLDRIKAAGATVVDADRQPAKTAAAK